MGAEIDHLEWELGKICHLLLDKENRSSVCFKTFLNIYNTTVLKLIKDFIEPLTRSFSSTIPEIKSEAFFELEAAKSTRFDFVSYSPICSTSTEKSPIGTFLENNALVFGTLILARLALIHANIEGNDKYFGFQACKYAQWFAEKYREVRKADRSSKIFEYIFQYYTAPIMIAIRQDNAKDPDYIENVIMNCPRGLLYFRACRVLLNNNMADEEEVQCRFIQDLHESCGESTRLWQLNVVELYSIADKSIYSPENFEPANLQQLILNINKFLNFGDHLLSSMQCWRLAKMFFVGSLSGLAFTDMAMDMARCFIDAAMKLDHMAYKCGERYEIFHKVLHEQGSLLNIVMSSYERRVEQLKKNILQLLRMKRCDDELAKELALPLLQEVAFYKRLSGPAFPVGGLRREDFLDILLYARLLNPRFSKFALKAILLKHGFYVHQHEHNYMHSKKLPEFMFAYLLTCYPILRNDQFIENMLPNVNLEENSSEVRTILRKYRPLSQRIEQLAYVCRSGTVNAHSNSIDERTRSKFNESDMNIQPECIASLNSDINVVVGSLSSNSDDKIQSSLRDMEEPDCIAERLTGSIKELGHCESEDLDLRLSNHTLNDGSRQKVGDESRQIKSIEFLEGKIIETSDTNSLEKLAKCSTKKDCMISEHSKDSIARHCRDETNGNFIDWTQDRNPEYSTLIKEETSCKLNGEIVRTLLHVGETKDVNLCRGVEKNSNEVDAVKTIPNNLPDLIPTKKRESIGVEHSSFRLDERRENRDLCQANEMDSCETTRHGSHQTHMNSCGFQQKDYCYNAKNGPNQVVDGSLSRNKSSEDPFSDSVGGMVLSPFKGEVFVSVKGGGSGAVLGDVSSPVKGKVSSPVKLKVSSDDKDKVSSVVKGKVSSPVKGKVSSADKEKDGKLENENLSVDVISILNQCKLASNTIERVKTIATGEENEQTSKKMRQNLRRLRSYVDVLKVSRGISYDFLNTFPSNQKFPEDKRLIMTLKIRLKEALAILIEKNRKLNYPKSSDTIVPAFEDSKKLRVMFKKLLEVPDDDQEKLTNWIQYVATIL